MASKWLDAQAEHLKSLNTIPSCMVLSDLKSDNYYKLVTVDIPLDFSSKSKLKVFKGCTQTNEQGLPGIPCAIESIYIDEQDPRIPVLAVAVGPSVLFYRNLKPYYKFTVPSIEIEPLEVDIWRKLSVERHEHVNDLIQQLRTIEISNLTVLSQKLINLPEEQRLEFIAENRDVELKKCSPVTVMTKIRKMAGGEDNDRAINCLVIGTDNGEIFVLDSQAFTILHQAKMSAFQESPAFISATGHWDSDFRIVIASRQGYVSILKKGWLEGKHIIRLDHPVTGLSILPIEQTIVLVCMNRSLKCYSKKGKQLWAESLPAEVVCMAPVTLPHLGLTLACVGLLGGLVQLYSAKKLLDQFTAPNTVSAMIFGRLGQEDHVLILNTVDRSLLIKILKRTANFSAAITEQNKSTAVKSEENQLVNLIPKKNKTFLEQMAREQENLTAMYQLAQSEMWKMRLMAARATLNVITQAETTLSGDIGYSSIKLAAEVIGYGPEFILKLRIENMSVRREAANLFVLLHANKNHYTMESQYTRLPPLLPNFPVTINFKVTVVTNTAGLPPSDLTNDNAIIKCMVSQCGQSKPLIAASVSMPMPEPFVDNLNL